MRSLFDNLNVRRSDPDTSHDAEEQNAVSARTKQCQEFLAVLRDAGPHGLTDHECHIAVLGDGYSHTPRLSDLKKQGLAVQTDERRVPPGKRCAQRVWVAGEYVND